jgi:predicted nuclease with TOPRIM domain
MGKGKPEDSKEVTKNKVKAKKAEKLLTIKKRVTAVESISTQYPDLPQMVQIKEKFKESYKQREEFAEELLKARLNFTDLNEKINKFVKQQNMLMIKVKGGMKSQVKSD